MPPSADWTVVLPAPHLLSSLSHWIELEKKLDDLLSCRPKSMGAPRRKSEPRLCFPREEERQLSVTLVQIR